jgi:hypothetical protein
MQRGFTKAWRKELYSSIWMMPPIYHRVWYWLRLKAQYEPFLFPTRNLYGIWVLPGQRLTSLQDIAEGVKYHENRREITPDRKTIKRVLEWLTFNNCIAVTCHTSGTLITIINWDIYNHSEKELATLDGSGDGQGVGHKKRIIKKEKEKDSLLSDFFEKLWSVYPKKDGKKAAEKHFFASVKNEQDMEDINHALGNYLEKVRDTESRFIKNGSTWFNNWRDWIPEGLDAEDAA